MRGRVNKALPEPEKKLKFEAGGSKEYEIEAIIDSAVYDQHANNNQMLDLSYLVLWKAIQKKKTPGSLYWQSYNSGS